MRTAGRNEQIQVTAVTRNFRGPAPDRYSKSAGQRRKRGLAWIVVAACPALILLILPVVPVVIMSFTSSGIVAFPPSEWGMGAYRTLIESIGWYDALLFSLQVAGLSVVLALVSATLAAIGLTRVRFHGRGIFTALMLAPLSVPLVVLGLSTFQFFIQFRLNGTLLGIVLAHAVMGTPYVFLTVRAGLSQLDISLVRSAMSLGAGPISILRFIYLPALMPALVSSGVLAFGISFDEVVVALFLSGPAAITLPVKMFTEIQYNLSPVIMAVSTLLFVAEVLLVIVTFVVARKVFRSGLAAQI